MGSSHVKAACKMLMKLSPFVVVGPVDVVIAYCFVVLFVVVVSISFIVAVLKF
jgi:hypothetical protein